jgi:signal peptidase II
MTAASSARWLWLTLAVIAADRATKYAVESLTTEGYHRVLIPGFAALVHNRNTGMAFGFLAGRDSRGLSIALLLIAMAVVLFLVWLLLTGRVAPTLPCAGLALLAGGAAGNLLDRVIRGAVTDFVELHAGSFYWPAFNLADSAITVGAALLVIEMFRPPRRARDDSRRMATR